MTSRICLARIGAAYGTSGEVRLWAHTTRAEDVAAYGPLQTENGARVFEIVSLRPGKDFMVARLKGVNDRSAAERLCNIDLYVPRERLPAPKPDEFYHADLIGLRAEDAAGKAVGTVVAIHNFGAGDILEIAPQARGETLMHPFTAAAVPVVEIAAGRIVVVLPVESEDEGTMAEAEPAAASGADRN
jgi:16S rRNA processing protein RimM